MFAKLRLTRVTAHLYLQTIVSALQLFQVLNTNCKMGHKVIFGVVLTLVLVSLTTVRGQDCRYGHGDDCIFPCNCLNPDDCDTTCSNGCQRDPQGHEWSGAGCQRGNIALGKSAEQLDTWQDFTADRAVDGRLATNASQQHCARMSRDDGGMAEWSVDLGQMSKVESFLIYSTFDPVGASTLTNLAFIVRNEGEGDEGRVCLEFTSTPPVGYFATLSVNCIPPAYGRYATLRRTGGPEPGQMTLCEVVIIGHPNIDCTLCSTSCDPYTGCYQCPTGKRLPDCVHACADGYYGVNCGETCGRCAGSESCDKLNGACPVGCLNGYIGPTCDVIENRAETTTADTSATSTSSDFDRETNGATCVQKALMQTLATVVVGLSFILG